MARDPFHPRILAAAVALAGLAVMMIAPNWSPPPLAFGVASLIAFGLLSLLADGWPKRRRGPRRIWVEVILDDQPLPLRAADEVPRSRETTASYPDALPAVRSRRALRMQ